MGTSRTSNKDVLDAIVALTAAITSNVVAAPAPIVTPAEPEAETVKVDKAYAEHMALNKCQPFADKHGEDVVLYARHNKANETKLAYCLASKFAGLKDRGLIGAVQVVSPS